VQVGELVKLGRREDGPHPAVAEPSADKFGYLRQLAQAFLRLIKAQGLKLPPLPAVVTGRVRYSDVGVLGDRIKTRKASAQSVEDLLADKGVGRARAWLEA
jgi:hypothetical protein